jgi:hypothetical protein
MLFRHLYTYGQGEIKLFKNELDAYASQQVPLPKRSRGKNFLCVVTSKRADNTLYLKLG